MEGLLELAGEAERELQALDRLLVRAQAAEEAPLAGAGWAAPPGGGWEEAVATHMARLTVVAERQAQCLRAVQAVVGEKPSGGSPKAPANPAMAELARRLQAADARCVTLARPQLAFWNARLAEVRARRQAWRSFRASLGPVPAGQRFIDRRV